MNIFTYIEIIKKQTILTTQEAWWLLEKLCNTTKTELLIKDNFALSSPQKKQLLQWIDELASHKPLAYILETVPFIDIEIEVKKPLLIPRPETEELASKLREKLKNPKQILDIGTGTGCLAISLAHHFKQSNVTGVDISPLAIQTSIKNAQKNLTKNTQFFLSDLYKNTSQNFYDVIVSNPPYIPQAAQQSMMQSVLKWEDHNALFSGPDGLDCIKHIINQSPQYFTKTRNGFLALEIDTSQGPAVYTLLNNAGFSNIKIESDMFDNTRFAFATYAKRNSS